MSATVWQDEAPGVTGQPRLCQVRVSGPGIENYCYGLIDPQSGASLLVDPAWDLARIERAVFEAGGRRVTGVLLTHGHPDHTDLAGVVARRWSCPVRIGEGDLGLIDVASVAALPLRDGERVPLGATSVTAVATPGHTPGSFCFLTSDRALTGDTVFIEGVGIPGDGPGAMEDLYASVQRLKRLVPGGSTVHPGHSYGRDPGETMANLRDLNIYLQFTDLPAFAAFRSRRPIAAPRRVHAPCVHRSTPSSCSATQ